jgi:hypothetical protein
MDRAWWEQYGEHIAGDFELWTSSKHAADLFGLNWIRSEPGGGISKLPGTIRQGGNSGFQAVGLALHFGAARVILLGFDMQMTGGRTHWHGDHRGKLGNPVVHRMEVWLKRFAEMAAESRIPIVNATRETALTCFPRVELKAALCGHG